MATTKLIYPYSDVFTSAASATKNFGGLPSLYTGQLTAGAYKTLIYFDISQIPANAKITSAILKLYIYKNKLTTDKNISIKKLNSDFIEYSVTNNSAPTSSDLVGSDPATLEIVAGAENQFIEIILTNTVTKWYLNGNSNHGIEISGPDVADDFIGFWSKEYFDPTLHPILEIQYEESAIDVIQIFNEPITPSELGTDSRQIDNSDCIAFTYYIDNPSGTGDVNVQLKGGSILGGSYKDIGNKIIVYGGSEAVPVYADAVEKYVRLSISGTDYTDVNVRSNKKGYEAMMSASSVYSAVATASDTIILTMTKELIGATTTATQFKVSIDGAIAVDCTGVVISGLTVTITTPAISAGVPVLLNYTATENDKLTGPNGNVAAFTGEVVTNNVP